ncbi:MAG: hypothetical protein P1V20_26605 [Verrucomicrobiales bacterium]|nr:hypothetical protein [Verrucomicrobiales bacterium]
MIKELDVDLIKADATSPRPDIDQDLARFSRANLPTNIVVPADPNQPLIMMPEVIGPKEALKALKIAAGG